MANEHRCVIDTVNKAETDFLQKSATQTANAGFASATTGER